MPQCLDALRCGFRTHIQLVCFVFHFGDFFRRWPGGGAGACPAWSASCRDGVGFPPTSSFLCLTSSPNLSPHPRAYFLADFPWSHCRWHLPSSCLDHFAVKQRIRRRAGVVASGALRAGGAEAFACVGVRVPVQQGTSPYRDPHESSDAAGYICPRRSIRQLPTLPQRQPHSSAGTGSRNQGRRDGRCRRCGRNCWSRRGRLRRGVAARAGVGSAPECVGCWCRRYARHVRRIYQGCRARRLGRRSNRRSARSRQLAHFNGTERRSKCVRGLEAVGRILGDGHHDDFV